MTGLAFHALPRAMLRRLCEPDDDLDDLAVLRRGALSKGLLRLRIIHDLVAGRDLAEGTATDLAANIAALRRLQQAHPDALEQVLAGPHYAAWATHCIRGLAGTTAGGTDGAPLESDLAQLGCFAAAVALRAGADIEVVVPARSGRIVVPAAGSVRIPDARPWARVGLRCTCGRFSVSSGESAGWEPLPRIGGDLGPDRRWEVVVDPGDPYFRFLDLLRVDSLDAGRAQRLQPRFASACAILATLFQHKPAAVAASITCVVPVASSGPDIGLSATSADAPGAIALTEPPNAVALAATLVHEHQHTTLNAVHDIVPLYADTDACYYSPWREDSRPASGLLHGAYAFLGVGEYWLRLGGRGSIAGLGPHLEFARITRQLATACTTLSGCDELTGAGAELVTHIAARASEWRRHEHPPDVARIAGDIVADHEVRWRLRHLVPDAGELRRLAARLGLPAEVPGAATPAPPDGAAPAGFGHESRLSASARLWAAGRHDTPSPGRLLIDGHYDRAVSAVLDAMTAEVSPERWVMLSVAARHTDLARRCPLLVSRPELVSALYAEARRQRAPIGVTALLDGLC